METPKTPEEYIRNLYTQIGHVLKFDTTLTKSRRGILTKLGAKLKDRFDKKECHVIKDSLLTFSVERYLRQSKALINPQTYWFSRFEEDKLAQG
jgi:hypothetical protein